ncbi:hypothetical protein Tco_0719213 [Tanacetum coccineum]
MLIWPSNPRGLKLFLKNRAIHKDDLDVIIFKVNCINPRSQENRSRSQDSSRRTVNVEESSSKAMLAIDGTGFDWSYMADEEGSINFALMAFSDSEGLESMEERLVFYKKNERMLCDQIAVLKSDALFNESDINALKKQVERLKKEKEDKQFKIDNFENASKRLEKFKQPEFEGYGVKVNKDVSENVSKEVKKNSDAPIIEDWVSDCDEDETVVLESLNVQKPKQADQPRKVSQNPRNNSTSWNTPMPKKLGVGFQFTPKACFVCGSFNHLIKDCDFHDKRMVQKPILNNVKKGTGEREVRPVWTNAKRVNHQKISNSRRNFAPTAVLTKSGLVPFSTARENFSRTAAPVSAARPFNTAVHKPFGFTLLLHGMLASQVSPVFALATPGQTATGKESSNPFMAGSLPKTINAEEYLISEDPVKQGRMERYIFEEVYRTARYKLNTASEYILMGMTEAKDSEVCKITRAYGSSRFHGDIQALLRRLDRQDLRQLYSLVQERFKSSLGSGVHSLFLDGTSIQINMLVEKKYPLKKEILEKMINLKIEAEEESTMAHELIKFIKYQIAKQS